MPFTFSHPAIVLPFGFLTPKRVSMTGLIIGSLTPDFEYFLRMRVQSDYSHTLNGLFWFDLPLGVFLAFLFHNQVRNSLWDNLPLFLKSRFLPFRLFQWNNYFKKHWLVVIISVLIGAVSHVFWDGFTHEHGYFVHIFPLLTQQVDVLGTPIFIFKILQHLSSLFGVLAISYTIYKLKSCSIVLPHSSTIKYWILLLMCSFSITVIRLFNGIKIHQLGNLIVTFISAILISLILLPLIVRPETVKE